MLILAAGVRAQGRQMAEIAVGGAINEGFSLIRRHPGAVLIWGVTQIALAAATFALYAPIYIAMVAAMRSGAGSQAIQAMSPQITQMQSIGYLIDVLQVIAGSVVWCAVFRAVLHPDRGQFAFLRLGATEFFVAVLIIGAYFALGIGTVMVILVAAIVIGMLVVMHLVWAGVIVGILAAIASLIAIFYFALRFSMVGPMIVEDGKFHLGESWALTKGHVGSLFMIGLLIFVLAFVAEIILLIVLAAVGAGTLAAIAGGFQNLPVFFQQSPQVLFSRLGPVLVIAAIIWIPFVGCIIAITAAPWARAYRDLQPPDLAATFS
jgi:hypothetical protein